MELTERGDWVRAAYKPPKVLWKIIVLVAVFILAFVLNPGPLDNPSGLITGEVTGMAISDSGVTLDISGYGLYLLGFAIFIIAIVIFFVILHYIREKERKKARAMLEEEPPRGEETIEDVEEMEDIIVKKPMKKKKPANLNEELDQINEKIERLRSGSDGPKKARIITALPCISEDNPSVTEKGAKDEKREINKSLKESVTQPLKFLKRFVRRKTKEEIRLEKEAQADVIRISKIVEGKKPAIPSEKLLIEEDLKKINKFIEQQPYKNKETS